ncbi:hypothetical protein ACH4UR_02345 [Streptomyces lydicus]|uniref:hypothetical protein n=1 Tax=Streptomyces TaxID=1883 RepID=UPI0037AADB17
MAAAGVAACAAAPCGAADGATSNDAANAASRPRTTSPGPHASATTRSRAWARRLAAAGVLASTSVAASYNPSPTPSCSTSIRRYGAGRPSTAVSSARSAGPTEGGSSCAVRAVRSQGSSRCQGVSAHSYTAARTHPAGSGSTAT